MYKLKIFFYKTYLNHVFTDITFSSKKEKKTKQMHSNTSMLHRIKNQWVWNLKKIKIGTAK